jgi:hypothetical protein
LLRKCLRERKLVPLDALVDIARPTHAILFVWSLVYLGVATLLWANGNGSVMFLTCAAAITASQVGYFLAGFAIERPPLRSWLALAAVPWYLVWKAGLTIRALLSLQDRTWVKTTRN